MKNSLKNSFFTILTRYSYAGLSKKDILKYCSDFKKLKKGWGVYLCDDITEVYLDANRSPIPFLS